MGYFSMYRFWHWLYRWNVCVQDGSIVFTVAGVLHFLKYKEHTIIYWGQGNKPDPFSVAPAAKFVNAR